MSQSKLIAYMYVQDQGASTMVTIFQVTTETRGA